MTLVPDSCSTLTMTYLYLFLLYYFYLSLVLLPFGSMVFGALRPITEETEGKVSWEPLNRNKNGSRSMSEGAGYHLTVSDIQVPSV